jgi:hypothetical protein
MFRITGKIGLLWLFYDFSSICAFGFEWDRAPQEYRVFPLFRF